MRPRLNLKDFTNKKFDENKIEEALNELRVYFKKQNRLLCLIGNDETLLVIPILTIYSQK